MTEKLSCPLDNLDPVSFFIECANETILHFPGNDARTVDQMAKRYVKSFSGEKEPHAFHWMRVHGWKYLSSAFKELERG